MNLSLRIIQMYLLGLYGSFSGFYVVAFIIPVLSIAPVPRVYFIRDFSTLDSICSPDMIMVLNLGSMLLGL